MELQTTRGTHQQRLCTPACMLQCEKGCMSTGSWCFFNLLCADSETLAHGVCCLQELRRGADPARIFSIAFSRGDPPDYLAVSSDKGTVHVFNLDAKRTAAIPSTDATSDHPDGSSPRNPVSTFKFMSVRSLHLACICLVVLDVCMLHQLVQPG